MTHAMRSRCDLPLLRAQDHEVVGWLASCRSATDDAHCETEVRRAAIALFMVLISACGNHYITKVDPETGVCYTHDRQWIIWQITDDVYRVDSEQCRP